MKVWTSLSQDDIYDIAEEVGVAIAIQQTSTEHWNGSGVHRSEIPMTGRAYSFGLRPLKSLGKKDGDYKYQRTSASGFNPDRRVFAVCWHGWRDFMLALLERDPNARIKTWMEDYHGRDDFLAKYEMTGYRQVGSLMYPMQAREICNCATGDWLIDLSVSPDRSEYKMKQSMIRECPFYIFDPSHYRADGTCKCDDPVEQDRMIREWDYTRADFERVGV